MTTKEEYILTTDFYVYFHKENNLLSCFAEAVGNNSRKVIIQIQTNNTPTNIHTFPNIVSINIHTLLPKNKQILIQNYEQRELSKDIIYTSQCKQAYFKYLSNKLTNNLLYFNTPVTTDIIIIDNHSNWKEDWIKYRNTQFRVTTSPNIDKLMI
jgi:hypothetical protein